MRNMFAQTMHVMSNQLVDIAGDRASGTMLCTARHLTLDRENTMNVMIRYVDAYERREGSWKIRRPANPPSCGPSSTRPSIPALGNSRLH